MLKRLEITINSNPICDEPIYDILAEDFKFYDKDGFELNQAEQKYYKLMGHPIDYPILNHRCWQIPWFELEESKNGLILDHCMLLHRCAYAGHALYQLEKIKRDKNIPEAEWLIKTPQKWGFDFALDAVDNDGNIYEVLHVEYDNYDYDKFASRMLHFDYVIRHTDWRDAAKRINDHKDEWKNLTGFDQNHWKSNFLIGWKKSEYTEKSLTFKS